MTLLGATLEKIKLRLPDASGALADELGHAIASANIPGSSMTLQQLHKIAAEHLRALSGNDNSDSSAGKHSKIRDVEVSRRALAIQIYI